MHKDCTFAWKYTFQIRGPREQSLVYNLVRLTLSGSQSFFESSLTYNDHWQPAVIHSVQSIIRCRNERPQGVEALKIYRTRDDERLFATTIDLAHRLETSRDGVVFDLDVHREQPGKQTRKV